MASLLASDARVAFLDKPKSLRHGEPYRDTVIREVQSPVIGYHGDDDLLFPDHIQTMLSVLDGNDFANPLPVMLGSDDVISVHPTDLSRQDCLDWHLNQAVRHNAVSLTGVVHTRESYVRLPVGWRTAPAGRWTDHYMWEQYFALDGFRARTARHSTTVKFASAPPEDAIPQEPGTRVREVWQAMHEPGFREDWDARVAEATWQNSVALVLALSEQAEALLRERQENDRLLAEIDSLRSSNSWRVTAPARWLFSLPRRTGVDK